MTWFRIAHLNKKYDKALTIFKNSQKKNKALIQSNCARPSGNIRDAYRKMFDFFLRAVAEK